MFNRLLQLFKRYVRHHGTLQMRGPEMLDLQGGELGAVERIELSGGRLFVSGWCFGQSVALVNGDETTSVTPCLPRADVTAKYSTVSFPNPGFEIDIPFNNGRKALCVMADANTRYVFELPGMTSRQLVAMSIGQVVPFTGAALRALPSLGRWYVYRDHMARAQIKGILGFHDQTARQKIAPDLLDPVTASTALMAQTQITIVLPVYNAFHLLPDVLARVLAHTDLPFHLIVIEDMSTDPDVRPFLQNWHAGLPDAVREQVTILENAENLGFIRSVNRAFEQARELGRHVVLLNSDAFVPRNWASRLVAPIVTDATVATVTPMSNDAEIFNVPMICQRGDLPQGAADLIDAAAARLSPGAVLAPAPTGVGFCMAMNHKYLVLEPEFDVAFGRGYGEEVDWCRRVAARGGRHLGHGGVFVEHRGGTSFGAEEKLKLVLANNEIISRRYAGYDRMVQDFIRNDPLGSPRLALSLAWAAAQAACQGTGPVPVYMAHGMGGGADHYLVRKIAETLDTCAAVVVLRVGGMQRWQVEIHTAQGCVTGTTDETDLLGRLMDILPSRHVVYSCGVGDRDAHLLPDVLRVLAEGQGNSLEILFHDFFPISPSYTLLDRQGRYHGVPDAHDTDPAHQFSSMQDGPVGLHIWQAQWGAALRAAQHLTVFSQNSADLLIESYPDVAGQVRVIPHTMLHDVPQVSRAPRRQGKPVIGVLGNVGMQKGAAVLEQLSRHLAQAPRASLVVVGNIDPAYHLTPPAQVHGSYEVRDLPELVRRYGITEWLMPSIWPETFSYATHEALATGLPVWAFDLGAQGDAARAAATRAGQGGVIKLDLENPDFIRQMLNTIYSKTEGQFNE